ncbi:MAG: NAD-dependent protein deacylase, partial [Anaerolineae bacterium]
SIMTFERDIQQAAELVSKSSYAVALTGAGISTPSGIPDFRSPSSGLWSGVDPMAVASIWAFKVHPQSFFNWVRPLARTLLEAQPNPAHHALADLEAMGFLKAVITQNIDGLHQRVGSKRVLELHGHMREATCLKCHKVVPTQGLIEGFLEGGEVPRCPCGGLLKPNVVLFGELLPRWVLLEAWGEAERCDLMLVAGSSLEVAPAADLPLTAYRHGAKLVIVNHQPTPLDRYADLVFHEDVAVILPRLVEACQQGHRR